MPAVAFAHSPTTLELTWSLLGTTRIAGGALSWLSVGRAAADVDVPARLEALRIEETGEVPRLRVRNDGPRSVLVGGNLVVKGGWQTRTIERSVVLGPGVEAFVPVRCVEAGRWSARDRRSAERFVASEELGLAMKRRTLAAKKESFVSRREYSAPQTVVWDAVADELRSTHSYSPTSSYEAFLDGARSRHRQAARRAPVEAPPRANGVLLQPADGLAWIEVLPTPGALASQLDRLLPDLYEAEERGQLAEPAEPSDVMARVWRAPLDPLAPVPGTLGDAFAVTGRGLAGEVLLVDGALAHLACGEVVDLDAHPRGVRRPRRGGPIAL